MAKLKPYKHKNSTDNKNRIRVRGKRLDQVDSSKITLAYWLLAKQIVEDRTDKRELTESEVRKVADRLDTVGKDKAAKPVDNDSDVGAVKADDEVSEA
jgi:hypothetical protein